MNHLSIIRNGVLTIAILTLLVASTYRLSESPGIWYDEGFYTQIAMNVAERGEQVLQVAPEVFAPTSYITVGYPLIWPLSASYTLFGVGVTEGRAVMVLFILALALAAYFLIRKLFGAWSATWTLLLLATFPMLYGNGKTVLGEIPGLFYMLLSLLALYYVERTNYTDWRAYVLFGLTAGVCVATKPFFILFLIALAITLALRYRTITLNWRYVALGVVALLLPIALWIYLQFGADASVSKVLAGYANPYAVENLPAHMLNNALRFVTESTPLYTLIMLATWAAALFLRRKRKEISVVEIAAFSFCILTVLSYLRLEGWYRYLFPATLVAVVFFPPAVRVVFDVAAKKISFFSKVSWLPYAFLALLSLAQLYQVAFSSFVAQSYVSTRTADVSAALKGIDPRANIFLYNTPELAILLPSRNYYQYLSPLPEVIIGKEQLATLEQGVPDFVLVETGAHQANQKLFERYEVLKAVDRYAILQKK